MSPGPPEFPDTTLFVWPLLPSQSPPLPHSRAVPAGHILEFLRHPEFPRCISLYEYQRKQLEQNHGLLPVSGENDRIWMLSDNFYDKELGFSLEGIEIQFLEV